MPRSSDEQEVLQTHLIQFIVKDIFNTITEDDILASDAEGNWTWRGHKLSVDEVVMLKEQAGGFQKSHLWHVLRAELRFLATKTLLEKGTTGADIRAAQLLGYLTDVIDKKLIAMLK